MIKLEEKMKKVRQKNWLLIITGILLATAVFALVLVARRELGIGVCYHNNIMYELNQQVSEYEKDKDCYCSWNGEIVCKEEETSALYENFSSENLSFSYHLRNLLEKPSSNPFKVTLENINYREDTVDIVLERETNCTEDGLVATQIGMYEWRDDSVILTTVSNLDETIYTHSCVVINTFSLIPKDFKKNVSPTIYYQNESGQLSNLNSCFFNEKFYASGDVFKDTTGEKLCVCKDSEIECERLK